MYEVLFPEIITIKENSPLGASGTLVPLGLGRSVLDLDRLRRLHLGVGDLLQLRLRQPLRPLHLELEVSPQLVWQPAVLGLRGRPRSRPGMGNMTDQD